MDRDAGAGASARARPGSSRRSAARPTAQLHRRALQPRVPGRAGARRGAAARGRGADDAADAEGVPRDARRRVPDATTTTTATSRGWSSTPRIEPTIGPYEVYEDEWFNYKAAFESFITRARRRRDDEARSGSARELQEIENNLPIDPKYRNPKLGALAPIRVVNTVFSAGDANRGVQTAAFNLPNDERVIREKGSQARDAEEQPGGEVRARCCSRSRRWRSPPADQAQRRRSTRSSRTS